MRAIAANVASNDALARVSDDLHALSAKVDQLSRAGDNSNSLASIEHRIAALTSSIETRERPVASDNSEFIEGALRSLSERLDRIPAGTDNASAFAHLEQRVTYLLERLETSGGAGSSGGGNLGRVEEGLQDILRHLENQHANLASSPTAPAVTARRSRWIPASSKPSGANCRTSVSASRRPTAAPRIRWKRFTARSAMWSTAWR